MRLHRIAGLVLVTLLLVACGSGNGDENNGSATADDTDDAHDTDDTDDTDDGDDGDDGDDTGGGNDEIDSVQWGPDDPPIPGEYTAFAADSAGGLACDSIDDRAEGDDFWTLAADVCRVFAGDGDWPEVEAVPPPSSEGNSYERCLNGELFEMLERALAWHDRHPGQSPEVRYPSSGIHSPCQQRLYDVGAEVGTALGGDCHDGEPVPTPGVPVSISAPGILGYANPRATVDGDPLCVIDDEEDNALRTFLVVVPTSGEDKTVTIEVETNYGILHGDVKLPVVEVETTETSVETTETSVETTDDATSTGTTDEAPGTTDGP
jgi:hypothetical protein